MPKILFRHRDAPSSAGDADFVVCDHGSHDNAPGLQRAVDQLAAQGGGHIMLPSAPRPYLCGPLNWRDGVSLYGQDATTTILGQHPRCRRPLIDLSGVTSARFEGLSLQGVGPATGSWASAFWNSDMCRDVTIRNCTLTNWAQHGISLDGVDGLLVEGCAITRANAGSGILCARQNKSRDVVLRGNTIRDTQFGNIHAWGPVERVLVHDNILDSSGLHGGSHADGTVADNITLYGPGKNRDILIRNNLCTGSAENGIHAAARGLVIEGNIIRNPALYGIIVSHKPYERPDPCGQVSLGGNVIQLTDPANPESRGIGLRNCTGFSVMGNQIHQAFLGIEVLGMGGAESGLGVINTNVLTGNGPIAMRFAGLTQRVRADGNLWQMQHLLDPGLPHPAMLSLGDNPQG